MGRAMPGRDGNGGRRSGHLLERLLAGLALAAALTTAIPSAMAQDTAPEAGSAAHAAVKSDAAPLKIELNRLEPAGEACRTYMLVDNSRGPALKSLKVDLFAFDTEGVAQKRLAVELGLSARCATENGVLQPACCDSVNNSAAARQQPRPAPWEAQPRVGDHCWRSSRRVDAACEAHEHRARKRAKVVGAAAALAGEHSVRCAVRHVRSARPSRLRVTEESSDRMIDRIRHSTDVTTHRRC